MATSHTYAEDGFLLRSVSAAGRGCTALPVHIDQNYNPSSFSNQQPVWWGYVEGKDVRQEGGEPISDLGSYNDRDRTWINYWAVLTAGRQLLLYRKARGPLQGVPNDLRSLPLQACRATVFCLLWQNSNFSKHFDHEDSTTGHIHKERRNRQRLVKVSLPSGAAIVFRCQSQNAALSLAASLHGDGPQESSPAVRDPDSGTDTDIIDRPLPTRKLLKKRSASFCATLDGDGSSSLISSEERRLTATLMPDESDKHSWASVNSSGNTSPIPSKRTANGESTSTLSLTLSGLIKMKLSAKKSKTSQSSATQPAITVVNSGESTGARNAAFANTQFPEVEEVMASQPSPYPADSASTSQSSDGQFPRGVFGMLRMHTRLTVGSRLNAVDGLSPGSSISSLSEGASFAESSISCPFSDDVQSDHSQGGTTRRKNNLLVSRKFRSLDEIDIIGLLKRCTSFAGKHRQPMQQNFLVTKENAQRRTTLADLRKRLFTLCCQLKEREELLEQLNYQLKSIGCQNQSVAKRSLGFEKKIFRASLTKDYTVVPGQKDTRLRQGEKVVVFGSLPNSRLRFSSGTVWSVLHCPPQSLSSCMEDVSFEQDWNDLSTCVDIEQPVHRNFRPRSGSAQDPPRLTAKEYSTSSPADSQTFSSDSESNQSPGTAPEGSIWPRARAKSLAASLLDVGVRPIAKKRLLPSSVTDTALCNLLNEARGQAKSIVSPSARDMSEYWTVSSAVFSIYPLIGSLPVSVVREVPLPRIEPPPAATMGKVHVETALSESIDVCSMLKSLSASLTHPPYLLSSSDEETEENDMSVSQH